MQRCTSSAAVLPVYLPGTVRISHCPTEVYTKVNKENLANGDLDHSILPFESP